MMPSPTNRRKFDHMTSDAARAPPPASANRRSNSLSNSIVNATRVCERGVDSGARAFIATML